jgi:hypothetical protein
MLAGGSVAKLVTRVDDHLHLSLRASRLEDKG